MHRCLEIPEIRAMICAHLDSGSRICKLDSGGPQPNLLALALSCKAWSDIALDYLWEQLDYFHPLVRAMPPDSWEIREVTPSERRLYLTRELRSSDIVRMMHYGRRVRSVARLSLDEEYRVVDDDSAISLDLKLQANMIKILLTPEFSTQSVLPNLLRMSLIINTDTILPLALRFLHPAPFLKELHIYFFSLVTPMDDTCLATLPLILSSSPNLLSFELSARSPDTKTATSSVVCQSSKFRDLNVGTVDSEALCHICRLPQLKKLSLDATEDVDLENPEAFPIPSLIDDRRQFFPALRALNINATSLSFIIGVLDLMDDLPLSRLSLSVNNTTTVQPWETVITKLANGAVNKHTLEELQCAEFFNKNGPTFPPLHILQTSVLNPFFAFPNLDIFYFNTSCHIPLNNKFLKRMALAWPKMRILSVHDAVLRRGSATTHVATLDGLVPFARYCPNLLRLSFSVDATVHASRLDPIPNTKPKGLRRGSGSQRRRSRLVTLDFVNSPIDDPFAVAAFLTGVWDNPRVSEKSRHVAVEGDEDDDLGAEEREERSNRTKYWNMVQSVVPGFKAIREQERKRLAVDAELEAEVEELALQARAVAEDEDGRGDSSDDGASTSPR